MDISEPDAANSCWKLPLVAGCLAVTLKSTPGGRGVLSYVLNSPSICDALEI